MPRADAEEIVFAWIRSDACGAGLKMMLDRASVQPLVDVVEKHLAAARAEAAPARGKALEEAARIVERGPAIVCNNAIDAVAMLNNRAAAIRARAIRAARAEP